MFTDSFSYICADNGLVLYSRETIIWINDGHLSCHDEFPSANMKPYLHFLAFLNDDLSQVVEIIPTR